MANTADGTTGGIWPAKRELSSGNSHSMVGLWRVSSRPCIPATLRMTLCASPASIVPKQRIGSPRRSCHSLVGIEHEFDGARIVEGSQEIRAEIALELFCSAAID